MNLDELNTFRKNKTEEIAMYIDPSSYIDDRHLERRDLGIDAQEIFRKFCSIPSIQDPNQAICDDAPLAKDDLLALLKKYYG